MTELFPKHDCPLRAGHKPCAGKGLRHGILVVILLTLSICMFIVL